MTFTDQIYTILRRIPSGTVRTYKEVAAQAGNPRAARAVGQAMRRNHRSFLTHTSDQCAVQYHRVIAACGRLGSFNGGLAAKQQLLEKEGWRIRNDRLVGRYAA